MIRETGMIFTFGQPEAETEAETEAKAEAGSFDGGFGFDAAAAVKKEHFSRRLFTFAVQVQQHSSIGGSESH